LAWTNRQKEAFKEGVLTMTRSGFAVFTWGLVTGIAMAKSSLSQFEAVGMSLLVYAGSAQLAALPLIAGGFPIWVALVTALIVNLRFVIFSAGLQSHFKTKPFWKRAILGYLNGDITFALFIAKFGANHQEPTKTPFFLGMSTTNWILWQTGSLSGIFLAGFIPHHWGLGFAGTLALIAIVLPMVDRKATAIAAITAAIVALLTVDLPFKLNMVCAVVAAIAVGMMMDKQIAKRGYINE
jgi:predicted branched-subunit amino acid permease